VLEQNFRSTQTILSVANAVIANNLGRPDKQLFTVGDAGDPVLRYRAEDERDEASWVSGEILRLRAAESLAWGDVAVFYRTNAQSRALEDSFIFTGIPYKVVGGAKFYDRREVKDVLAYVRVLANPDDEVSARRIVNVPKRGIGDTSVARLAAWAQVNRVSFSEAIDRAEEAGLTGKALRGAEQLSKTWPSCGRWSPPSTRRLHPAGGRPHRLHGRAGGRAHPRGGRAHREHRRAGQRGRPSSTTWSVSSRRWPWWPTPTTSTVTAPGSR
jgi:superfamily I DNA/RNA helicase